MKIWQAFAAALNLIHPPDAGDHVQRVETALRRAAVTGKRKMVAAKRVVQAEAQMRDRVEQEAEVIREKRREQEQSPTWGFMREVRELAAGALANIEQPHRRDREPNP